MNTLIINREHIAEFVDLRSLPSELRKGFIDYSCGLSRRDGKRIVLDIGEGNTATVLGPGTSASIPAYTIKANSKFPQSDTPIKGAIALFDINNGNLLALLDSSLITATRTGLCAAMATDLLASAGAKQISIIGAGKQNTLQMQYLLKMRTFERLVIYDVDPLQAKRFRQTFAKKTKCIIARSTRECVAEADVILVATWSKTPVLELDDISRACHITSLGADEKGKVELSQDLVEASSFYCDDIDLNLAMGTPGNLGLSSDVIRAEIGTVFANPAVIEADKYKLTAYSSVGLPFQDLITAWHVYERARKRGRVPSIKLN